MPLVEQELPTLPEYVTVFLFSSGVCIAKSLVFCVVFCRPSLVFSSFESLNYYNWLLLWYLKTFLKLKCCLLDFFIWWCTNIYEVMPSNLSLTFHCPIRRIMIILLLFIYNVGSFIQRPQVVSNLKFVLWCDWKIFLGLHQR